MSQWYVSYDGQQFGPMERLAAASQARARPDAYVWREGFAQWRPAAQVSELDIVPASGGQPRAASVADAIDFEVHGNDMQFVEVELDPGESAVSEAGALMYKAPSIVMRTVFGDGAGQSGGFMDKLLGAGKRVLTGESLFMTVFTHEGTGKARIAFAAPYPGTIVPVALPDVGGRLICQKDAFLCAARGVSVGLHFQKRMMTGLFGGEGFIMQKLEGDGMVFLHAGGTVVERDLAPGECLHVDTGCLVALRDSVTFDVEYVGGVRSALFGGEGLFFVRLTGPGHVWLQSLPFSRLAGRVLSALQTSKGEGSVLGTLVGGDRR